MKLQENITRENINSLMHVFYTKALEDEEIGEFFESAFGADMSNEHWVNHMEVLTDFWATMLMGERAYKGNPFGHHALIPDLKKESFMKWIGLFSASADSLYIPELSKKFKQKGKMFSQKFMQNLIIEY